jgi:hypothetical protein
MTALNHGLVTCNTSRCVSLNFFFVTKTIFVSIHVAISRILNASSTLASFLVLFFPLFAFNSHAAEGPLLSDGDRESIYFFSYHCPGCYAVNEYITLYDLSKKNIDLIRIPVYSDGGNWQTGANVHILINTIASTQNLSDIKKSKFGFFIVSTMSDVLLEKDDYKLAFRIAGYPVSDVEFDTAWRSIPIYLSSANEILKQARLENEGYLKTPSIRVYANSKVSWVFLDEKSSHPGVEFVKKVNEAFND